MPSYGSLSFLLHPDFHNSLIFPNHSISINLSASKAPTLTRKKKHGESHHKKTTPFMACATTRPTFSFYLSTTFSQSPHPKPKTQFLPKIPTISLSLTHKPSHCLTITNSIDVSKEDKPISDQSNPPSIESRESQEEEEKIDKRRLEEKFAVLNTGIYECRSCGYKYDEAVGDPTYPLPPGMQFEKLPEDWRCPTCGAAQSFFVSKSVEIAGFAENQQFGLGGNSLTSGQKTLVIFGSLFLFFTLFLSGYFLQ